jgi:molecular chaperone DnaK
MVREAEENAEADKASEGTGRSQEPGRKPVHATEKSLEEHGDKVDPSTVEAIELARQGLKETDRDRGCRQDQGRHPERDRSLDETGRGDLQGPAGEEPGAEDMPRMRRGPVDDDIVDADFEDLDDDARSASNHRATIAWPAGDPWPASAFPGG